MDDKIDDNRWAQISHHPLDEDERSLKYSRKANKKYSSQF